MIHPIQSGTDSPPKSIEAERGEPTWAIAELYPRQGEWTEGEFLELSARTNRLIELSDGCLEILPLPTRTHSRIIGLLRDLLVAFLASSKAACSGEVFFAGYPVKLWQGKFREPDVLVVLDEHAGKLTEQFTYPPDLAIEIVSEDRKKDLEEKRAEYAQAAIPEYWIVDPRDRVILVLTLTNGAYAVHGEFTGQTPATSILLSGFSVIPDVVWAAAEGRR